MPATVQSGGSGTCWMAERDIAVTQVRARQAMGQWETILITDTHPLPPHTHLCKCVRGIRFDFTRNIKWLQYVCVASDQFEVCHKKMQD